MQWHIVYELSKPFKESVLTDILFAWVLYANFVWVCVCVFVIKLGYSTVNPFLSQEYVPHPQATG